MTYEEFVKRYKEYYRTDITPSRNYYKKQLLNPSQFVVCSECLSSSRTLKRSYKDGQLYCDWHVKP